MNELNKYLYVEFNSLGGKNWVGCFERGLVGFNGVSQHPNKRYFVIVAGGEGYIVDPLDRKLINNIGNNYREYFQEKKHEKKKGERKVTVTIKRDRHVWVTSRE